jgi:hypothetical protein
MRGKRRIEEGQELVTEVRKVHVAHQRRKTGLPAFSQPSRIDRSVQEGSHSSRQLDRVRNGLAFQNQCNLTQERKFRAL